MDIEGLKNINIAVAENLLKVYEGEDKLVFPDRRDENPRYSEQEARVLFCRHLQEGNRYKYAVEAPTREEYSFTGEGSRSGNIDIAIYDSEDTSSANIELKFGAARQSAINKDFEKLVIEPNALGNWFHFLSHRGDGIWNSIKASYKKAWNDATAEMTTRLQNNNLVNRYEIRGNIKRLKEGCKTIFKKNKEVPHNEVEGMIETCDSALESLLQNGKGETLCYSTLLELKGALNSFVLNQNEELIEGMKKEIRQYGSKLVKLILNDPGERKHEILFFIVVLSDNFRQYGCFTRKVGEPFPDLQNMTWKDIK
jgi:hypothetical protein